MNLDELIKQIEIRPGAFLGDDIDNKSLYHFIEGYLYSRKINNQQTCYEKNFNCMFRDFVINEMYDSKQINENHNMKYWYEIIQKNNSSNQNEIQLFFRLYKKFKEYITLTNRYEI